MRDWVATHLLRRNGRDRGVASDNIDLNKALVDVLDGPEIDALFDEERKTNPQLDRWLDEQFISSYSIDDFKDYPPDTVGGLYHRHYLVESNFRLDIHAAYEPSRHYDYFRRRVERYFLPGFAVMNFVVHESLDGGGLASRRIDPNAKGRAQQLLEFPVPVPAALAIELHANATRLDAAPCAGPPDRPAGRYGALIRTEPKAAAAPCPAESWPPRRN